MPEILGAFAPNRSRTHVAETECVREVHAQLVSLGGAIILAICIILSMLFAISTQLAVTSLQQTILGILTLGSWLYYFDSVTEKLKLSDHAVEYTSALTRRRHIPLNELQAMLLVHEGFNLERGMESIEFRREGKKPDRVSLGPCWQRNRLEAFLHAVEEAMHDPHILEEVR